MVLTRFEELIEALKKHSKKRRITVAVANEAHTIEAVMHAAADGLVEPHLVGDEIAIRRALKELGYDGLPYGSVIYNEVDSQKACEKAVALVRDGVTDFLMKGNVDTKVILKAVVNKDHGLGTGRLMSHFALFEVPSYHKLLVAVDGGMVPYPTVSEKCDIIENSVDVLLKLGYTKPKIGVLSCVEKVNSKMPETVEADAVKQHFANCDRCIVEGPISYDLAVSKEAALLKAYDSPVAGDVDVLVAPNIHAGNILGKLLMWTASARLAAFVVGAQCPIVLTSRASSADEKYMSIVLSAIAS